MPARRKQRRQGGKHDAMWDRHVPQEKKFYQLTSEQKHFLCADLIHKMWHRLQTGAGDSELWHRVGRLREEVTMVMKESGLICRDFCESGDQMHVHTILENLRPREVSVVFLADICGKSTALDDICICYIRRFVNDKFGEDVVGSITVERIFMCFAVHRVDGDATHFMDAFDGSSMVLPVISKQLVEQECCICFTTINERVSSKSYYCPNALLWCSK